MTISPEVAELLQSIERPDDRTAESALLLGLLLDDRDPARVEEQVRQVFGSGTTLTALTLDERHKVVDALIRHADGQQLPVSEAVWALTKCRDDRRRGPLYRLLERSINVPASEHTAYQALVGLSDFSDREVLEFIRRASQEGSGEVRDTALRFLSIHAP
jgi:hypothetical protein